MTKIVIVAAMAVAMHSAPASAGDGLVTKPSKYSVKETIDNFEAAINAQAAGGWVVFGRIDRAAEKGRAGHAPADGHHIRQPQGGHAPDDQERYTGNRSADEGRRLAGRSGQGLTYNTSEYNAKYVFPRHSVATSGDVSKALETFLTKVTDQSTQ